MFVHFTHRKIKFLELSCSLGPSAATESRVLNFVPKLNSAEAALLPWTVEKHCVLL